MSATLSKSQMSRFKFDIIIINMNHMFNIEGFIMKKSESVVVSKLKDLICLTLFRKGNF